VPLVEVSVTNHSPCAAGKKAEKVVQQLSKLVILGAFWDPKGHNGLCC
jgi:hypothetical protein